MVSLQFKRSVSLMALATALGTTGLFAQSVMSVAGAADIHYSGASDVGLLQSDPTSETAHYKSLYPNAAASQSTNVITVNGNVSSASAVNGRDVWNTDSSNGKIVAAPFLIYGGVNIGANGTSGDNVNGAAGADISGNSIIVNNVQYDWTGQDAEINTTTNNYSAFGGGSIIGGLSIGGSGALGALSGNGGAITNNSVTLTNVNITGSIGHQGGGLVLGGLSMGGSPSDHSMDRKSHADGGIVSGNHVTLDKVTIIGGATKQRQYSLSGGQGGMGGGSVIGGVSMAGTAGTGGAVYNNIVTLTDTILVGGNGGNGLGGTGGGGHGGLGGGSVIGGVSYGGTAEGHYLETIVGAGAGGDVTNNQVSLNNVTLTGAQGGQGNDGGGGGGGYGGAGGGTVIGGASFGGSGVGDDIGGGKGGAVTLNKVVLNNVTLIGGSGGIGAEAVGGGGHGGIGGGSVIGGLSTGGSGGFDNGDAADDVGAGIGGFGGSVSQNEVIVKDVTLVGAKGGLGGESEGGGYGSQGVDGGSIFGGLSIGGTGGFTNGGNGGDVTGNKVSISGASLIWGNVYGGYSMAGEADPIEDSGIGGAAINNIVTLEGSEIKIGTRDSANNIVTYGAIYGGYSVNGDTSINGAFGKVVQGNTLNLVGYRGTVSGIYNFETYNWTLPSNVVNGDTLVTIADGGTAVDLTNTKHNIADMKASDNRLQVGDSVTFINKTSGEWSAASPYTIKQGQFIIYEATLAQQENSDKALVLTIGSTGNTTPTDPTNPGTTPTEPTNPGTTPTTPTNPGTTPTVPTNPGTTTGPNTGGTTGESGQSAARVNPQSKSYLEGRAAALGFVAQGNDLISTSINGIRAQAFAENSNTSIVPFIIMNGSSQRNETGSHVDIKGFNMALGIATGFDFSVGHKATLGAFFEYGRGTYDTYNSFTNFASVYGDGDSEYKGGGILARIDFVNTGLGRISTLAADQADGVYLEASLRAGRISSNFDAGRNINTFGYDIGDYRGSYDSTVTYYGGHVAGGYVFNFDEKQSLDAYGRYLWTHMDGDTVAIGYEKLHFDSSTSSRIQLGGRYGYAYNEQFKPYFGAAYEYEFDGDVAAKAYEFALDKPSLGGSTGIFEAGFNIKPISTNKALSVDVNGQGYVGQRQGGGGGVKLKYQF